MIVLLTSQVIGIILAFSLPAAAAMDIRHMTNIVPWHACAGVGLCKVSERRTCETCSEVHSSVLAETAVVIPLIYQSGLNETIQSISQHMASKAAEMGG